MSEPHTVAAAMAREELTEDEAYFILRFAGHHGYKKAIARLNDPLNRWRRKVLWVGGWERPKLRQWDEGLPAFEPRRNGKWVDPTPVTLLNRLTFFGDWLQLQACGTYLVISWRRRESYAYVSPNGTPSSATHWLWGKRR